MTRQTTRIIFVLTYPAYHSVADPVEWLRWDNRDRRMPALLAALGADVELWGVGAAAAEHVSAPDFGAPYRIRLFEKTGGGAKSRNHFSDSMVTAARSDPADLFVLIGTNGGAGYRLFDRALRPDKRPFALIIGGDYWSRLVPHARLLFTECALQEEALAAGGWFRPRIPLDRMERLPKTIDTGLFRPIEAARRWDVLSVSRVTRWKSFAEIGMLSRAHRAAVAGGGPDAARMARRYPAIDWLGHRRHAEIPALLAQAGLYFHAGRRDYLPRAIPEAMACGRPVVGFADRLGPDVIPPDCGLRVTERDFRPLVAALLRDPARMAQMGAAARAHVVATHGLRSSEAACRTLLRLAETTA
ncbi:glycosyltransferase [Sphingomonas phyllosphaerae]|uniref:glycosyltransferase n=1 Tax=Sphingomonas phyllosphaerae TaxID=257003 RepID=UPI0004087254|nr:glycosyltransferase [Sphingomonas phyllosphaerae]